MILPNFLLVKSLKVLLIFVFALISSGCFMHYTNEIPLNQIHDGKDNNLSRIQLPIKLKLDRSNVPKSIKVNIIRSSADRRSGSEDFSNYSRINYLENYYSEEILAKFKLSDLFINNPDSNVLIVIKPLPEKVEYVDPDKVFTFYSLGLIPTKKSSNGKISFEIMDLNKNEKIKEYTYELSHSVYEGLSMFLLSPFIPLFSDYIDHSTNERTFSIMRRAYDAFSRDLTYDLSRDPKLLESFYINDSPNYSVQFKNPHKQNKLNSLFLSSIESSLISKGFQIFEVGDGYTDMTKIDRSIIIENLSFEKMEISKKGSIQIKYDAICKASKYDRTFWKQNIDYTTSRGDLKDHELIQNAVQVLFNELRDNGDI